MIRPTLFYRLGVNAIMYFDFVYIRHCLCKKLECFLRIEQNLLETKYQRDYHCRITNYIIPMSEN